MRKWKELSLWMRSNWEASRLAPYTGLFLASDLAGWVLDEESKEIIRIAGSFGIPARMAFRPLSGIQQCVHYTSQFSLASPSVLKGRHRISVDYFHGRPEEGAEFSEILKIMARNHSSLSRVRISCSTMKDVILGTGVDPTKVHQISIGINPGYFRPQTPESKKAARERLGIPQSAILIGSFQKDGNGWGEGLEPKWVKGPDVFVKTLARLKERIPEIAVLLTGPSRGYVKRELQRRGIPFFHSLLADYSQVGEYFQALDAYIVASRVEGGPKAILESMVSRVPIISTRVGQAVDIIQSGANGYLAEVENSEELAEHTFQYLNSDERREAMLDAAIAQSHRHTYDAQKPLWEVFWKGYVENSSRH